MPLWFVSIFIIKGNAQVHLEVSGKKGAELSLSRVTDALGGASGPPTSRLMTPGVKGSSWGLWAQPCRAAWGEGPEKLQAGQTE